MVWCLAKTTAVRVDAWLGHWRARRRRPDEASKHRIIRCPRGLKTPRKVAPAMSLELPNNFTCSTQRQVLRKRCTSNLSSSGQRKGPKQHKSCTNLPVENEDVQLSTDCTKEFEITTWVLAATHRCAMAGCVSCRAKVLRSTGALRVPNARPESCPRFEVEGWREPTFGVAQPIGLYLPAQRILTVGDGDLTFSLALARALGGTNLTATCYEVRACHCS